MLHRFLFVAGMTVGVMTPLVWAAYVGRPAPRTARLPAVTLAKATPEAMKPAHAPAEDVTAAIPPVPAATRATPKAAEFTLPKPAAPPDAIAPSQSEPARSHPKIAYMARRHRTAHRYLPAVVDRYNGAHIITVCAALTENEQLRAGCP